MDNKFEYIRQDETIDDLQLKGLNLIQKKEIIEENYYLI